MNRNDFSEKLVHLISTPQDFPSGVLAIVRVNGFTQFNEKNGRPAGDQLLQKTAQLLGKVADSREHVMLARMDGPEFVMMVPEVASQDMPALGDAIVKALAEIEEFPLTGPASRLTAAWSSTPISFMISARSSGLAKSKPGRNTGARRAR